MGCGGQDEPAGKSGIPSDEKKGWCCELWAISYPIAWSKILISEVLSDLYFPILFGWHLPVHFRH